MRRRAFIAGLGAAACGSESAMRLNLSPAPNEPYPAPALGQSPTLLTPLDAAQFGGRDVDADTVTMFAEIPAGAPAVTKMDFYVGAALVGTALAAPWQYQWPTTQGVYAVRALATYADSSVGVSAVANITVAPPTTAADPSTKAPTKFWGDLGHANTLNAGGTQAAIGDVVASYGRYKDGTIVTTQMVQATVGNRCRLALWRGKKVLETCTQSVSAEDYAATISAPQLLPSAFIQVYRGISIQSAGVCSGSNGSEKIGIHGTVWPRTNRCISGAAVDDTVAQATGTCTRFVMNNTASEVWRQGVKIHGPVSAGASGVSGNISFPGHSSGSAEPGIAGDFVYAQGTVGATDATDYDNYFIAKFDLLATELRGFCIGDSMTVPTGLVSGGWRKILNDYFQVSKICNGWIDWIGAQHSSPRTFGGDAHDGVALKGINYHLGPGAGSLPTLLGAGLLFQPDFTIVQIGSNNAASGLGETYVAGNGAGSTRQALRDLATLVLNSTPGKPSVWTNICNHPTPAVQANIVTLNSTWRADIDAAAAALGRTVEHADWNTAMGFPPSSLFQSDGHPTQAGCVVLAQTLLPPIVKSLYKLANGIP